MNKEKVLYRLVLDLDDALEALEVAKFRLEEAAVNLNTDEIANGNLESYIRDVRMLNETAWNIKAQINILKEVQ